MFIHFYLKVHNKNNKKSNKKHKLNEIWLMMFQPKHKIILIKISRYILKLVNNPKKNNEIPMIVK